MLALSSLGSALPASAAALEPGSESNLVTHLQLELRERNLYRGPIDGIYGGQTAQAVMAFHKHLGLERSFTWSADDWSHLDEFRLPAAQEDDQVVVDLDRQLLYMYLDGEVSLIPISSGNGEWFRSSRGTLVPARTPQGQFSFYRHIDGLRRSYLGVLYRPWYFYGGYAIHGSPSVPGEPASHGCVRVPNWEADWLADRLSIGMKVTVGGWGVPDAPEPHDPVEWGLVATPRGWSDGEGRYVR